MSTTSSAAVSDDGYISAVDSSPRRADPAFTASAFTVLLRSTIVPKLADYRRTTAADSLRVGPMDEVPDVSTAWVYGLYSAILHRLPDRAGLVTFTEALRAGLEPGVFAEQLRDSSEAVAIAAQAADDLQEAFVNGCYLTALGRPADSMGLRAHVSMLRGGTSAEAVLDGLLSSEEAQSRLRMPPPGIDRIRVLAETLQVVVLATAPDEALTASIVAQLGAGVPVLALVRGLLRRDRKPRAIAKSFLRARTLAKDSEAVAGRRAAAMQSVADQRWRWRVDRHVLGQIDELHGAVRQVHAALDEHAGHVVDYLADAGPTR